MGNPPCHSGYVVVISDFSAATQIMRQKVELQSDICCTETIYLSLYLHVGKQFFEHGTLRVAEIEASPTF